MGFPFAPSETPAWAPRSEFSVTCSNGGETIKIKWIPVKENTIGAGQIASVQDSFYYSKEDRYAHCKSRRWRALLCSLSSSFESLGNHSKCIRAYNSIYCNQFEYSPEYILTLHTDCPFVTTSDQMATMQNPSIWSVWVWKRHALVKWVLSTSNWNVFWD